MRVLPQRVKTRERLLLATKKPSRLQPLTDTQRLGEESGYGYDIVIYSTCDDDDGCWR